MAGMKKTRKSAAKSKRTYKPRYKKRTPQVRWFTETAEVSNVQVQQTASGSPTTGQVWSVSASTIPQFANYSKLYSEFKIIKVKFQFVPYFGTSDKNQQLLNSGSGGQYTSTPIIAYAVNTNAATGSPVNELAVLTQNNSRIRRFDRPFSVTVKNPQPDIDVSTSGPSVSWNQRGWMSTGDAGIIVEHLGLHTYVTDMSSNVGAPYDCGRVYAHITFGMRYTI